MIIPNLDPSLAALLSLVGLGAGLVLYVWTALALAAMFRKMGEQPWKAWVPFLNVATLLAWGGFSPWLVLLALTGVGVVVVWILVVVAAHRVNPGFGYGDGMTVVAALLFVVWASILGFGPARWLGARPAAARPIRDTAPTAAARVAASASAPPPAVASVRPLAAEPVASPTLTTTGEPGSSLAVDGQDDPAAPVPSDAHDAAVAAWAPPAPPASSAPSAPARGAVAASLADGEPTAPDDDDADVDGDEGWPSEIDDVSAVAPAPFPPSSAAGRPHVGAPPVGAADGPIAFVPGRRPSERSLPPGESVGTPVTRVPADPPTAVPPAAVPPAPPATTAPVPTQRRSPAPEYDPDAFPELSGEVSAVVGSPAAGAPRSALSSVSAQQRRQEPFGGDDLDQTIIARRHRHAWELVPASGAPVGLTAKVVIVGRQPAPDPAFPGAQLVALDDATRTVSKTHARLELRPDGWTIIDLHSTNGVLLPTLLGTEVEVEPGVPVPAGDRFLLGDAEVRLRRGDG